MAGRRCGVLMCVLVAACFTPTSSAQVRARPAELSKSFSTGLPFLAGTLAHVPPVERNLASFANKRSSRVEDRSASGVNE